MKQDTSHCVIETNTNANVCVGCCLFQLYLWSLFFIIYSVIVHIQYFTELLYNRLSYVCTLTVPLIGDQVNLFPENDSSNSLEHVSLPPFSGLYMQSLSTGVNRDKSVSCYITRNISNYGCDKKKFTPQLNC